MATNSINQGAAGGIIIQPTWGTIEGGGSSGKEDNFDAILNELKTYLDAKADKKDVYTKDETDELLDGKSNTGHTHDDRYYTESEIDTKLAEKSNTGHTHDDRYYTESEINTKLAGKSDTGHTHSYLPLSGGTLTNALTVQTGGIWVQGGSNAGGNNTRMGLSSGMPDKFPYNQSKRGVYLYSNAIALADPYNGNSNNDAGWIRHLEETGNQGTLEIAVGDDGNESIVARQYNTSSAIVRTLTLLDGSGNTTLPGSLNIQSAFNSYSLKLSKENVAVKSTTVVRAGLDICGPCVGNDVAQLKGSTAGVLSYGDGGPQIRFSSATSPGSGQNGAIIFSDHDAVGTGVSWSFVSDQSDCYVVAKHFKGTLVGSASLNVLKSGDTMSGALNFANNTWNKMGDDCYIGDCNVSGCVGLKGINGATGLRFIQRDGTAGGTLSWNGSKFNLSAPLIGFASGSSWYLARDYCVIRQNHVVDGSWAAVFSCITKNGDWSVGTIPNSDELAFSYVTNTNYTNKNNVSFRYKLPAVSGSGDRYLMPAYVGTGAMTDGSTALQTNHLYFQY